MRPTPEPYVSRGEVALASEARKEIRESKQSEPARDQHVLLHFPQGWQGNKTHRGGGRVGSRVRAAHGGEAILFCPTVFWLEAHRQMAAAECHLLVLMKVAPH